MGFWDFVVDNAGDLISGGASVAGSLIGANAAQNAGKAVAASSENAAQAQLNMYNKSREDLAPYRDVGKSGLYTLASALGAEYDGAPGTIEDRRATALNRFSESPGYQFRFNEGVKARERGASARGKLHSGAQDKALLQFGQDIGSNEWNNWLGNMANLSGIGYNSTNSTANYGANTASNVGNLMVTAGNAKASGIADSASAYNNGLNNLSYILGR